LGVCFECLGHHDGAEIGASDTDVNNGVNPLACVALPLAAANGVREGLDVLEHPGDLIRASLGDLELVKVTEGDVKDSTVLRGVDVLAGEHLVPVCLKLGLTDEREKSVEDRFGDEILGVVEEEGSAVAIWRDVLLAELGETLRILGKEILQDELAMLRVVGLL
jgi:hypothetical protein